MTKRPVHKQTQNTQKHLEHQRATDIQTDYFFVFFGFFIYIYYLLFLK